MQKIVACLVEVFPDCDPSVIKDDSILGDIPGWDSMNSVNLLMTLEATFSVSLADKMLSGKQTVVDVAALLRSKGVVV